MRRFCYFFIIFFIVSGCIASNYAFAQSCIEPPQGVAAWWPADGTADDAVGTNNGVMQNGATFVPGLSDQAFSLDGIDDYVSVADVPELNPTEAITVSVWVNRTAIVGFADPIVKKAGMVGGSQLRGYALEFSSSNPSDVIFWVYIDGLGWSRNEQAHIPFGEWTHIAGVYDGSNIRLYVNGVLIGTPGLVSGTIGQSTNELNIGRDPANPNRLFRGLIDEVTIYSRALTQAEIQAVVNAGSAGKCKSLTIKTKSLPAIELGKSFAQQLERNYGESPFTWAVITGTLPHGLTLSPGGLLSGIPTELGSFSVTIRVAGANGEIADRSFTIEVIPPLTCAAPPVGIVSWWPFDETGGTIAEDIVGNHSGRHINGPVPSSGKAGGALHFDGVDDFVGVDDSDLWAFGTDDFTIELWANFDVLAGSTIGEPSDIFIGNDEGSGNRKKWFFALGGRVLNLAVNDPSIGAQFFPRASFAPNINQWHHLAITRDVSLYTIFVDGVPVDSAVNTSIIPNPSALLTIGQAEHIGFMNGLLDEVTIYNRALTQGEIQSIVSAGSAGKCKSLTIKTKSSLAIKTGEFFSQQFETVSGEPPFTWTVIAGTLPPGLSLSPEGVLSGTPTELGSFPVTVRVVDANGNIAEKFFTIEVVFILPPPDIRINKSGMTAVPGRVLDYFIVVENTGNIPANNVEVVELLDPLQVSLLSVDPPAVEEVSVLADASFILWNIPTLTPGEAKIFTYQVKLDPSIPFGTNVPGTACVGFDLVLARAKCVFNLSVAQTSLKCLACVPFCAAIPFACREVKSCILTVGFCARCLVGGPGSDGLPSGCAVGVIKIAQCLLESPECKDSASFEQPASGPIDPNEKEVVAPKFIQPDQILVYPIHFENIGGIEAIDVFVSDTLDPNLDVSTLKILTPGGAFDEATRTIHWALLGRNLQPGETGNVLFSIKPLPGLPSGTEIHNYATIQFEVFEPIVTNEVVNIIDTTAPSCIMDPLPNMSAPEFTISWNGADTVGEIESYSVFVSVDGQGFTPFLEETLDTAAVFTGGRGNTYEFLCVAVDTSGNAEAQSAVAEAVTTVFANRPPVADAGSDQTLECTAPSGASVTLDGLTSSDPDGDVLAYIWTGSFGASNYVSPTIGLPVDSHIITLTVDDGHGGSDSDNVAIVVQDTTPPDLQAPADIIEECTGPDGQTVNIGVPRVADICSENIDTANDAPLLFHLGSTSVNWKAVDEHNNISQSTQTVSIVDTIPPNISVACAPNILWPPNHKMVEVTPTVIAEDICDAFLTLELYQITMNEGEEANTYDPNYDEWLGAGNAVNDIQVTEDGRIFLRAERSGNNLGGREYAVVYKATDASGNTATASCKVSVPHDVK